MIVHMYRRFMFSPCVSIRLLNSFYLIILPIYKLAIGSTDAIQLVSLEVRNETGYCRTKSVKWWLASVLKF